MTSKSFIQAILILATNDFLINLKFLFRENRVFKILMAQILNIVKNEYSFWDILHNTTLLLSFFL